MTNQAIRQRQREATQRWKDSPKPKRRRSLYPATTDIRQQEWLRASGREKARRKAQIGRGQLRAENGLATV